MIPTCTWGGWLNWQICEFEVYRFPLVHSKYALEDEQDKDDENVDCSCLADMHLHFCESLLSARAQLDLCFVLPEQKSISSCIKSRHTSHFVKPIISLCFEIHQPVFLVLKWPTGVSLSVTQQHLPCCLRPLDVCYCNLQFWRKQCFFLPISNRHRWGSLLGGFQEVGSRHQAGWSCPGKQTSFLLVTISFHQQSRSSHNFHINLCFVLCL